MALSLLGAGTVALVGCTPPAPEPTAEPYPAVVWEGGGPAAFVGDPWADAVQASLAAQAVAENRNDFQLPELESTTGADLRADLSQRAVDTLRAGDDTRLSAGPWPFTPVIVDADEGASTATVRGCLAKEWPSADGTPPTELSGIGFEYRLEQLDDDTIQVVGTSLVSSLDCADVELPVGTFDPPARSSGITNADDVVQSRRD